MQCLIRGQQYTDIPHSLLTKFEYIEVGGNNNNNYAIKEGGGGVLLTCKSSTDLEKMLGIAEGNIWREAILEHFAVLNDDFFMREHLL